LAGELLWHIQSSQLYLSKLTVTSQSAQLYTPLANQWFPGAVKTADRVGRVDIGASEHAGVSPSAAKHMKRLLVDRRGFKLTRGAATSSGREP
jgi:hypothetical protein